MPIVPVHQSRAKDRLRLRIQPHLRACEGLGLAGRSTWEIESQLASGALITVLDKFTLPDFDIVAIYAKPGIGWSRGRGVVCCAQAARNRPPENRAWRRKRFLIIASHEDR